MGIFGWGTLFISNVRKHWLVINPYYIQGDCSDSTQLHVFHRGRVVEDSILVRCENLSLIKAMSTGSAKVANIMWQLRSLLVFLGLLHYWALTSHIARANSSTADHSTSLYRAVPMAFHRPTAEDSISRFRLDTLHLNVQCSDIISGDQPLSTGKTYNLGVPHYMSFNNQASKVTVPTSKSSLVFFSYLASCNLSCTTINYAESGIYASFPHKNASHTFTRYFRANAKAELPFLPY